ncbi:uncharacterized protein LOC124151200 [Haliotis rufescens]|uniref:uncharacterized protein LOC124151200 n=1 Tax=Haliotis rufescens TaxID=6454 RepID=UPI001EB03F0A|nr:uncharacterized protein LOC124151200 [Haliotis rufescens]
MMTAGPVFTSSLTPGIYVPRWSGGSLYVPGLSKQETRDVKSSYSYTDTSGVSSPLRILGATSNVNGRRVQSSFAPTIPMRADSRELTSLTLKAIYSKNNKKSIEALPLRPAMARAKQVPGRYFPKAILTDEQKVALASAKPSRPSPLKKESFPPIKGLDFMKTSFSLLPPAPRARTSHNASFNPKIAQTRKSLRMFPEVQTEVFSISFQGDTRQEYDPNSELHSDYYSVTRVSVNSAKDGQKSQMKAQPSSASDFRIVLRGHRKLLHDRGDDKDDDEEVGVIGEREDTHHSETSRKESEVGLPQI